MKVENNSVTIGREDVSLLLTLSDGFDYWGHLDYDDAEYKAARNHMKDAGLYVENGTYFEDILAFMICDTDYPVYVVDEEEGEYYRITKDSLENGFLLNLQNRPEDGSLEDGDAETGDCILQYAIFGDIIYG